MKKSIALLLTVMLTFSLAACSANEQNTSSIPDTGRDQESIVAPTKESKPDTDGVDAVAGASIVVKDDEKLGNTGYVARLIQESQGGNQHE